MPDRSCSPCVKCLHGYPRLTWQETLLHLGSESLGTRRFQETELGQKRTTSGKTPWFGLFSEQKESKGAGGVDKRGN